MGEIDALWAQLQADEKASRAKPRSTGGSASLAGLTASFGQARIVAAKPLEHRAEKQQAQPTPPAAASAALPGVPARSVAAPLPQPPVAAPSRATLPPSSAAATGAPDAGARTLDDVLAARKTQVKVAAKAELLGLHTAPDSDDDSEAAGSGDEDATATAAGAGSGAAGALGGGSGVRAATLGRLANLLMEPNVSVRRDALAQLERLVADVLGPSSATSARAAPAAVPAAVPAAAEAAATSCGARSVFEADEEDALDSSEEAALDELDARAPAPADEEGGRGRGGPRTGGRGREGDEATGSNGDGYESNDHEEDEEAEGGGERGADGRKRGLSDAASGRAKRAREPALSPAQRAHVSEYLSALLRPLLLRMADEAEACRAAAARVAGALLRRCEVQHVAGALPLVLPVLVERLGQETLVEPSEEVRAGIGVGVLPRPTRPSPFSAFVPAMSAKPANAPAPVPRPPSFPARPALVPSAPRRRCARRSAASSRGSSARAARSSRRTCSLWAPLLLAAAATRTRGRCAPGTRCCAGWRSTCCARSRGCRAPRRSARTRPG